jgi:AAA domain
VSHDEKPWLTDPVYGGMSELAAERSWRAAKGSPKNVEKVASPKSRKALPFRRHRDSNATAPRYLIKNLLPEKGAALLAGQWGTFKSFLSVAIAAAVATGKPFIGHHIKRQGAVVIFACEGAAGMQARLDAVSEQDHGGAALPIYYVDANLSLLDPISVTDVIVTADLIAQEADKMFRLPLSLIVIDTIAAAAGYARAGDENDASVAQRLMNALNEISQRSGALIIGLDHYGKSIETGTRGSSAKEGGADVVLGVLADKAPNGKVTNMRLVVRKQRNGPTGQEFPFRMKTVTLGTDEDDEPFSSLTVEFYEPDESKANSATENKWTRSLILLRRVLMALLADAGEMITPFADAPSVRAIRSQIARTEFYRQYVTGDEDPKKRQEAKRKAFTRALESAQGKGLITVREIDDVQWVWLSAADGNSQTAGALG